ncbi:cadherin-like beta sandwich domain-containing protein [Demequina sp. NBRC 110055]|uniref:cadherin-like beta sandwich domain-containing protein n=1 Tax=Demequina sp. NBRC 110055 TaxID=1570344 RepID=UPI000A03D09D|nr:cadherin-like beta sandwich domain-containing protein [Demequina sp. NBRC 110055]
MTLVLTKSRAVLAAATVLLTLFLATVVTATPAVAAAGSGSTYYVDADGGDDTADGTSPATAWRSLEKVNATTFAPGDVIRLESGDTWTGQLWPQGSGTSDDPITIASYGDGAKPALRGQGEVGDVVRLFNQQHWIISELDVSNATVSGSPSGSDLKDLRGIHVSGDSGTTLSGFVVRDVDVHDVTGEVNWISGDVANNEPGVTFKTGWDGSKKTGGIVFDAAVADIQDPQDTPTILNDVLIEGSSVVNTSFAGIVFKQYTGDGTDGNGNTIATATGWGTRANASDPAFAPHTNVVIRGNYVYQDGTDYGCNGMYLTNIRGALVEHNVVERAGTSGIETYYADDVTIQYNEVYDTQRKAGGADSNGIDPDKGTTNQVIQYNYLHGNGDGVLICQFVFGDAVIRYNVITESSRYPIYLHSDRAAVAHVYNNTVYNTTSNYLAYGYGSSLNGTYHLSNNVFYSSRAGATLTTSPTITYDNNLYSSNLTVPDSDAAALVGDPLFSDTNVTGPYGDLASGPQLDLALGFAPLSGSKAVNTAASINGSPAVDYAGVALPNGQPDVGAFEYATPVGATTEAVAGFVTDPSGRRLSGATVSVTGVADTETTDARGWFRMTGVPLGDIDISATRTGYEGEAVSSSTSTGTSALVTVVLESNSTVGTASGTVRDVTGAGFEGASVEISGAEGVVASGVSDSSGAFAIETPIGDGYTIRASAPDMRPAEVRGITIDPAATSQAGALLLQPMVPEVIFQDTVDDRPVGTFANATDGYTVSQSGGSVSVTEVEDGRAFTLARNANSGTTELTRAYSSPLTGIVTVQARVMKVADTGSNSWFSVPYIWDDGGAVGTALAFSKGDIVAYQGTSSSSLMRYTLGQWYTLTQVLDTVNQTFDLMIDGVTVIEGAGFRNPMDAIGKIQYYANSSNYSTVRIDNVLILQGSQPDTGDGSLASLSTSAGVPVADTDGYRLDVPAATSTLDVWAIPGSVTAQGVEIGGVRAEAGESVTVPLDEGLNDIPISVIAENGSSTTYTLRVTRGFLAADATLASLGVEGGTLSPSFSPDVEEYAVAVPVGTSSVVVTPVAVGPSSDVTVNGDEVTSGSAVAVTVEDGSRVVVEVASADGTAVTTYTLTMDVQKPNYLAAVDFESFETGPAVDVAPLVAEAGAGVVTVVATDGNQYGHLERADAASGASPTALTYTAADPITGVITVQQRVRRPEGQPTSGATFFGAPYIRNAQGEDLVSIGFSDGNISARDGATYLSSVGTYAEGEWVLVTVVIDTTTQTYSLSLDGERVLDQASLRNPVRSGIAVVTTYANTSNNGSADIDDVRIWSGEGYAPSMTALAHLTADPGELTRVSDGAYSLVLDAGTDDVTIAAEPVSPFASVAVDGTRTVDGTVTVPVSSGPFDVTVTAEDGSSATTVIDVVMPPAVQDDVGTVVAGQSVDIDVLANDGTFPPLDAASLTLLDDAGAEVSSTTVDEGTFVVGDGFVRFAATAAASGEAIVTYRVTNASGLSGEATVRVTVQAAAPAWDRAQRYTAGDTVLYDGALYRALWNTKGDEPGGNANGAWAEVGAAAECHDAPCHEWTSTAVYNSGDTVAHDDGVWVALWWSRGEKPGSQLYGAWAQAGAPVECTGEVRDSWTSTGVYVEGDVVVFDGAEWTAGYWTRNQEPGTAAVWARTGTCR